MNIMLLVCNQLKLMSKLAIFQRWGSLPKINAFFKRFRVLMYTFLDFELITDNWIYLCRSLFSKMSTKTDLAFAELNSFWNSNLFVFLQLCKNEYTASSSSCMNSSYFLRSLRMQPLTQGKMFFFWLLLQAFYFCESSVWLRIQFSQPSSLIIFSYQISVMISCASSAPSSNLISAYGLTTMSISSNFIERFELTLSIIRLSWSSPALFCSIFSSCCPKNSLISVSSLTLLSSCCTWLQSTSKGPSKKLVNRQSKLEQIGVSYLLQVQTESQSISGNSNIGLLFSQACLPTSECLIFVDLIDNFFVKLIIRQTDQYDINPRIIKFDASCYKILLMHKIDYS